MVELETTSCKTRELGTSLYARCFGTGRSQIRPSSGCSGDVLPVKDLEGLLQALDLLLPPGHAVLVAHPAVHAGGLQLLVVGQRRVDLLLLKGLLLVLLLRRLVLHVLRLLRLVHR